MSDPFDGFLAEPRHARSRPAMVSRENPYSRDGSNPYLDIVGAGLEPFQASDTREWDRGARVLITEISVEPGLGYVLGFGYALLANGRDYAKRKTLRVPIALDDVPNPIRERLGLL